jgi:hypothetical protein
LPEDFYDEEKVKRVYYEELKELLKSKLGASRVEILEHGVCADIFVAYFGVPKFFRLL